MNYFRSYFPDVDFDNPNESGEVAVLCPFKHTTNTGAEYFESTPSAHINVEKDVFHCKVCHQQHSEASFFVAKTGVKYAQAVQILSDLDRNSFPNNWRNAVYARETNRAPKETINKLKFSDRVVNELQIGFEGDGISFPVFVYGQLMDVRKYRMGQTPKVLSRAGTSVGYIIPDITTMKDLDTVYLCAGEKDMAIMRSMGFDAYTLTGGEQTLPHTYGYAFRGKKVYILYDNDTAGIDGAKKMGFFLKELGALPYLVFGHHKVCTNKGGDVWDFFVTYDKKREDMVEIIRTTPEMSTEDLKEEFTKTYPQVTLSEALEPMHRNKYVTSQIQVIGVYNNTFGIPDVIEVTKHETEDTRESTNTISVGTRRAYTIEDKNIEDILYLMDSGLKDVQVLSNIKKMCKIPAKEAGISVAYKSYSTVYKSTVVNYITNNKEVSLVEVDLYSLTPLENGHKYQIIFKVVQHPLRQQELVIIAKKVESVDSELSDFVVDEDVIGSMKVFQKHEDETVDEAMERLFELDKGYVGGEANRHIVQTVDLTYHTPLDIKVGKNIIRGTLDAFLVGETRTGKSETSKIKQNLYGLGSIINLGTTTVAGLIGGTNKATNKTKIGLLPREHKNLVVLEEFSSMKDDAFIKSMTEIRSSNIVRIVRVDTDIKVPCQLRMVTISNPKSGAARSLKSYPNGIEVIMELVDSPENIARYDFFTLIPEPSEYISFLDYNYPKLPEISYKNRVRWAWTRKPENVIMSQDAQKHLWDKAVELNKAYNTHIKLFGTEAWKKIARIAVACACMLVSTDDEFENVYVTKEHIDWASNFLISIYDNDIFKLRQFVEEQRKYTEVDSSLIHDLEDLYANNATLFNFLEMTSGVQRATLRDISGKSNEDFSVVLNEMARLYLFKWSNGLLVPSERLRKGLSMINKNIKVKEGRGNIV